MIFYRIILLLIIILSYITQGNLEHRVFYKQSERLDSNTYIPPTKCAVKIQINADVVYMYVNGRNSSVFCRRLISEMTDSYMHIEETLYVDEADRTISEVCKIKGEFFLVSVVSTSGFGKHICQTMGTDSS